ncbi:uncharacterized protein LOC133825590 [Humulus lupulus]|uniref:uncharacterized protein LOC133825590 n=1 Tax=Humulus lupulus TaxID=3486 RepID=UPI002B41085C|nr:uncharacterized protein LOC133825590 [Humulus lupulus]
MEVKGGALTWDNHRSGEAKIKSILDKGIVNNDGLFSISSWKVKKPFRFEAMWTRDIGSHLVIDSAWKSYMHWHLTIALFRKVGVTRLALIRWNRDQFGNLKHEIQDLESKLHSIQTDHNGNSSWCEEAKLRGKMNELYKRLEIHWQQKPRIDWLKNGNKCTKFFFLLATIRHRQNFIASIKSQNDEWLYTRDHIGQAFLKYFKEIYSSSNSYPQLDISKFFLDVFSEVERASLSCIPTHDENRQTLFKMGSFKAPGPDGISVMFLKNYWEIMDNSFIQGHLQDHCQ